MDVQMDAMVHMMSLRRRDRREGRAERDPVKERIRQHQQNFDRQAAQLAETLNRRASMAERTIQQLIDQVGDDFLDPEVTQITNMRETVRELNESQQGLKDSLEAAEGELKAKDQEKKELQQTLQQFQEMLRKLPHDLPIGGIEGFYWSVDSNLASIRG